MKLFRCILVFVLMVVFADPVMAQALPDRPFKIGWVGQIYQPEKLAAYAQLGVSSMVADGSGWFIDTIGHSNDYFDRYLKEAAKYNISVTFKLSHSNSDPRDNGTPYDKSISLEENRTRFINMLTKFSDRNTYPSTDLWIIGDEPNLDENNPPVVYDYLTQSPGYYDLTQAYDPGRAMIVFCCYLNYPYSPPYVYTAAQYAALTDVVAWDYFPGNKGSTGVPKSYDSWKFGKDFAEMYGKKYMVWGQGFGNVSGYNNLTYEQVRYHMFSAIVQGIKEFYFWTDSSDWTNETMTTYANQMIGQAQEIGRQMNSGVTNDSGIGVSVTDTNQLTYRHGVSGTRHVILAVNIANRSSSNGLTLSNVKFTLPSGLNPSVIEVLDENRTLPVTNRSFTDSFSPFAVHVYAFDAQSVSTPTPTPGIKPGDANGDGKVDIVDMMKWLYGYGKINTTLADGDFDGSGRVDGKDYIIWRNNYGM